MSDTTSYLVLVEVRPRPDVADPAGATVERSLPALGFDGITQVRVGKAIRFLVRAENRDEAKLKAERLADTFLANPVIEEAEVSVLSSEP